MTRHDPDALVVLRVTPRERAALDWLPSLRRRASEKRNFSISAFSRFLISERSHSWHSERILDVSSEVRSEGAGGSCGAIAPQSRRWETVMGLFPARSSAWRTM